MVVFALFCCPSSADSANGPQTRINVSVGQYTTDSMGETARFFGAHYEKNYILALAYNRDFLELDYGLHLGGEVGLGYRFGSASTGEIWGGVVIRAKGITSREGVTLSPSLTVGLSLVSKPMGEEIQREIGRGGDATLLFYLGPEIVISLPGLRRWEFVYRLHHRSGAGGILGGLYEGYNANTFAIRYRF